MSELLQSLLARRSVKYVRSPGPDQAELDLIMQAAVCGPDHGAIRPWRFRIMQGAEIAQIIELGARTGAALGKPLAEPKVENARKWLAQVPLVIAIAARHDPSGRIPGFESEYAVAAAVMNMLNAAHALAYAGFWSTGMGTYLPGIGAQLGFDAAERFMGYLAIGTPIEAPRPLVRPDWRNFLVAPQGPPQNEI